MKPIRLTIVQTHPVQYNAPWFRYLTANCPEIAVTVVYASRPRAEQQGAGFDCEFTWDTPLYDGYTWEIVRESHDADDFSTGAYRGLDVKGIGKALEATRPDVILVPGWYSVTMMRCLLWARARGVPVLYRGDTNNSTAPEGVTRILWNLKARALLALYSGYLSVGTRSREYLLSHGVSTARVFASPHVVDNDAFAAGAEPHLTVEGRAAARARFGARESDFVVLFAGKLESRKRPLDAVRAVSALGPNAMLAIAGAGDLDADVIEEASRLAVRVAMVGFINQSRLGPIYAAADCLLLPSETESWGLVINEAMATGLPAVVSDGVGAAPDLIVPGVTGEVARKGDVKDIAKALDRVRVKGGRTGMAEACRARAARHTFAAASTGLVAACQSVTSRERASTRVIACCGGMVIVSGLERMTFEVLSVIRRNGGDVHCIVNTWENHRIVDLAERIGASWSTGFYWYSFSSRLTSPLQALQMLWEVVRTSAGLVRAAFACGPTHVLVPEHVTVLRNAPALALLRLLGVKVVFRLANAPDRGRFHDILWHYVLPPFVSLFVPNSRFGQSRLTETGVPTGKVALVRNALSRRSASPHADDAVVQLAASRRTILAVGQIAPFKGTHLVVEATLALLESGSDVQAIIVGELPGWPEDRVEWAAGLRERIAAAGASDRVHFVGARENVLEIMKASYVLATPILQEETFGNVALEARAVGLPVVTFARGGLTELVEHGRTGYICRSTDLPGLLEGLNHYLSDPAARDAASAGSLAVSSSPENDCTPITFAQKWWSVFRPASSS